MGTDSEENNAFDVFSDDELQRICETILSVDPDDPEALRIAGVLAVKQGDTSSGIALLKKASERQQDNPYLLRDLALVLADSEPLGSKQAYADAARLFHEKQRFDLATACLQACLALAPEDTLVMTDLALVYQLQDKTEQARDLIHRVLQKEPRNFIAAVAEAYLCLPSIYRSTREIDAQRAQYARLLGALPKILDALEQDGLPDKLPPLALLGNFKPFGLPYQGFCDRDMQETFGQSVVRYARLAAPVRPPRMERAKDGRIRVGFVSEFVRTHSVHKLFRGWMEQLDRQRFHVHVYAVGGPPADAAIGGRLDGVESPRFSPRPKASWEETILADQLDVLIHVEIGMGCRSFVLATHRLAPVQCVAWGHPETTGLPTIDYFLSSELMEPAGAAQQYTERLVRLPNLSVWYEPPARVSLEAMTRSALGLRDDAFVFACTQSTYKYLPRYDDIFPRIAARVPQAQFLFLMHPGPERGTAVFKERLADAFAAFGLPADRHCVFAPRLAPQAYLSMHHHVDAFLDSIGWSGGVTTLEALDHDLPVITLPVGPMRGRHGEAFLRRLDIPSCIAASTGDYVALAARLAFDLPFYRQVRHGIATRKTRLYRDAQAIRGLEDFLTEAVRAPTVRPATP